MFEKYGNFNSYEEINEKAAELLAASDEQSLKELNYPPERVFRTPNNCGCLM
ncbi:MAG: hypothetical protein IJ703_01350 [Eubacterium sp.]|nr:hypothetical protein [Eubacterium sp.]